eukprot:3045866-Rhodomonas_salina.2
MLSPTTTQCHPCFAETELAGVNVQAGLDAVNVEAGLVGHPFFAKTELALGPVRVGLVPFGLPLEFVLSLALYHRSPWPFVETQAS